MQLLQSHGEHTAGLYGINQRLSQDLVPVRHRGEIELPDKVVVQGIGGAIAAVVIGFFAVVGGAATGGGGLVDIVPARIDGQLIGYGLVPLTAVFAVGGGSCGFWLRLALLRGSGVRGVVAVGRVAFVGLFHLQHGVGGVPGSVLV